MEAYAESIGLEPLEQEVEVEHGLWANEAGTEALKFPALKIEVSGDSSLLEAKLRKIPSSSRFR